MLVHIQDENVVSIYPFLPLLGFCSATLSFLFCSGLVLVPVLTDYQGSLTFISDGMDFYCGWSSAILGSTGMFIAFCELAAALHTHISLSLLTAILIQAPTWCILVGVSGTGWPIHYAALTSFMLSTFYFHWCFANTHPLAAQTIIYQQANLVTALNLLAFAMAFAALNATPYGMPHRILKDVAVSLELTLLSCITSQTFCLSWVLLQYRNIHILFENDSAAATAKSNHHNDNAAHHLPFIKGRLLPS